MDLSTDREIADTAVFLPPGAMNRHPHRRNAMRRCQLPALKSTVKAGRHVFPARTGFALGSHAGEWAYPDFFN